MSPIRSGEKFRPIISYLFKPRRPDFLCGTVSRVRRRMGEISCAEINDFGRQFPGPVLPLVLCHFRYVIANKRKQNKQSFQGKPIIR